MNKDRIRIGSLDMVNKSTLDEYDAFDLIFGGFEEFVYVPDYYPWELVNGTWTGAFGHLMNDIRRIGSVQN